MVQSNYLKELTLIIQSKLGDKLLGLYLSGSVSLEDFVNDKSDLDVVGVIKDPLEETIKDSLAFALNNKQLPCPAKGLDIILMTKNSVQEITPEPQYEFWYSTGEGWPDEKWTEGKSSEILLFIELCRQNGITLFGVNPIDILKRVNQKYLMEAFAHLLNWHKKYILDEYHDPNGQNSVLNACRIHQYLKTNKFHSKTEGALLYLQENPKNRTVQKALKLRLNNYNEIITKEEILDLIRSVEILLV